MKFQNQYPGDFVYTEEYWKATITELFGNSSSSHKAEPTQYTRTFSLNQSMHQTVSLGYERINNLGYRP
jgi:hypothetical protein